MATSFNTGTTADSGNSQTASQAITIPAGVNAGDVILFAAGVVAINASAGTITASSTATNPVQIGSPQTQTVPATPATLTASIWKVTAGPSDAGATVTFTSTIAGFWAAAVVSYAGAGAIDVSGGTVSAAGAASVTCPTLTTATAGDWAVFLTAGTYELGTLTGPAGSTQREKIISAVTMSAAIFDSNASVGGAGTSIGGGTFSDGGTNTNNMLAAFTIGLAPAGGVSHTAAAAVTVTPATSVTKGTGRRQAVTVTPATSVTKGTGRRQAVTVTPATSAATSGGQRRGGYQIVPGLAAAGVI